MKILAKVRDVEYVAHRLASPVSQLYRLVDQSSPGCGMDQELTDHLTQSGKMVVCRIVRMKQQMETFRYSPKFKEMRFRID